MNLNNTEKAMLAGEMGKARQRAIIQQIQVGDFFDAVDFVPVAQAHIMADTESLGEAGVCFLENLANEAEVDNQVCIPTITDPRGADFNTYKQINHDPAYVALEKRADQAFRALGVLMTDTCINYQTVIPPVRGEHLAMGDTGVVIYSNSVFGARTNYEGGPSAVAAALTGRTPRYGFHLDENRHGTRLFQVKEQPKDWSQWGALGGFIGREMGSYYEVPVIEGIDVTPSSDDLKHFGAAMASFGSTALFHMVAITPEAPTVEAVFECTPPVPHVITAEDMDAFFATYAMDDDALDVVVFAAPQLSLYELERLAKLLKGQTIHSDVALLIATNPENKRAAERMGLDDMISGSGAILMEGVCFYQMHARELGEANAWTRLMTNSAKLVNIISGYGYEPVLSDMERCVQSAIAGKIVR